MKLDQLRAFIAVSKQEVFALQARCNTQNSAGNQCRPSKHWKHNTGILLFDRRTLSPNVEPPKPCVFFQHSKKTKFSSATAGKILAIWFGQSIEAPPALWLKSRCCRWHNCIERIKSLQKQYPYTSDITTGPLIRGVIKASQDQGEIPLGHDIWFKNDRHAYVLS